MDKSVILWVGYILLVLTAITGLFFSVMLPMHKMETASENPQIVSTVILPGWFDFLGHIDRDGLTYHDRAYEARYHGPSESSWTYVYESRAVYQSMLGDVTTTIWFSNDQEEIPSCPTFVIWDGVIFLQSSECTTHEVGG